MTFFDAGRLSAWRRRRQDGASQGERGAGRALPAGGNAPLRHRILDTGCRLGLAIGLVAATTAALLILVPAFNLNRITISYLIPILIAATWGGMAAGLASAVASVLALAFFFYPPQYAIYIADPEHVVDLIVFLFVALLTSHLTSELRSHAEAARRREREIAELYGLSRRLAACHTAADIHRSIEDHLSFITRCRVALFGTKGMQAQSEPTQEDWVPVRVRQEAAAIAGRAPPPRGVELEDEETGHAWVLRLLSPDMPDFGIVAIDLGKTSAGAGAALQPRIDAALADVAATLRRLEIDRAINEAKVRSEADLLREALIGSVSHELRAPLASILGSATMLLEGPGLADNPHLEPALKIIRDEAERLNAELQDLLDAARISSKGVRPRLQTTDPLDLVNAALERKRARLAAHRLELDLTPDLPFVEIDPMLIEQALGQVLENAAKYSPAGSTIQVTARRARDRVVISVRDEGAGLTEQERTQLWHRFFRGERHLQKVSGFGVGLWIAQAFIHANNGTIVAESEGAGRGTTIMILLPAAREDLHAATGD